MVIIILLTILTTISKTNISENQEKGYAGETCNTSIIDSLVTKHLLGHLYIYIRQLINQIPNGHYMYIHIWRPFWHWLN